ncbi:MAG: orotidine-5'-phosphate decarboxylase [Gloeomargarita sp. SKYBB_i_bin120]|nr:orotidine-5'-phosphate decarboxylase [Gloeomargarita sp. SKYG98]MCS7292811.1 orotidine-5'-phosphate decarboxylase [Gloeomargarita sp. SKYB120]MDW8178374.1 orotidine-5'-phosphate decarboxylase [Gloeomargarita sp. SKYBB_i_bin120]
MASALAERLIVALDVPDRETALGWVERLPQVQWWKVGLELFTAAGPVILTDLKARRKSVFLDLKYHDIPRTVARACQVAARYGVDLLTLHAAAGSEALAQAQAAVAGYPLKLVAVTLLTSIGPEQFSQEFVTPLALEDYVLHWAQVAQRAGLAGVVCSPWDVRRIKQTVGPDFLCVCPGIRWQGMVADDQRRTWTPQATLAAGADYVVLGRPLLQAEHPEQVWRALVAPEG